MTRLYKDKLHYSPCKMDSYRKTWNFAITEREDGKTTAIPVTKIYKAWRHHNRPSIILRRQQIDITDTYIQDLQDQINDFLEDKDKIKFEYKKASIGEGICDITVEGRDFCRLIAISTPKSRIKSLRYEDPAYMIMDEFIVDNRNGEKYLKGEAERFREIYKTFNRFAMRHGHKIKCYFLGNPYSVYNPYFIWLGVDLSKVKPGAFVVGSDYVVDCHKMKPELRAWLLERDPLYQFDDAFARYQFSGEAINDQTFPIEQKKPVGYKLRYIFRLQNKYLHVWWKDRSVADASDYGKYWIEDRDRYEGSKNVVSIDFNNLVEGTQLVDSTIKIIMYRLKQAIAKRDLAYSSIAAGYLAEAIYSII